MFKHSLSILRKRLGQVGVLASTAFLVACAGLAFPYKAEVVQGNVVTQEQAALLKVGMSRGDVRDVLGTPLLTDVFHADRWDYVFTIRRQGTQAQQRRVTVLFANDVVKSFEAPDLPSAREFVASIDPVKSVKAPKLVLDEAELKALPVPEPSPVASAVPRAPRTYPPLVSTP